MTSPKHVAPKKPAKPAHVPGAKPHGAMLLDVLFGNDEAAYEQFVEQDVAAAVDFAKKELSYHEALNRLGDNQVDPVEIVDEAIARLLEEKRGARLSLGKKLQGLVAEVVPEDTYQIEQRERRELSVEGNIKDPAEEDGFRTIGEHVLDFWQPDKDDSIYQFIADPDVPTPAEILDMKDQQTLIYRALAALPRQWRESFVLIAVSGWTPQEVALWRDQTLDQVKRELSAAQSFVRERLREQGQLADRQPRPGPHQHERG
ncbi:MAG: hypothetical protein Q8P33_02120 [bacterium]|nr:hypothetical protein [bacterium]